MLEYPLKSSENQLSDLARNAPPIQLLFVKNYTHRRFIGCLLKGIIQIIEFFFVSTIMPGDNHFNAFNYLHVGIALIRQQEVDDVPVEGALMVCDIGFVHG